MTLTVKQIEAAHFGAAKERLSDGGGLYVRLYPSGRKAFQVQVPKEAGTAARVWVNLGHYPDLSLKEARETANLVRLWSRKGWSAAQIRASLGTDAINRPDAAPAAEDKALTPFRDVAKVWFERKVPGLKNGKHIAQNWTTMETYVFPRLGSRPIGAITGLEIIETLRPIWHSKNETAQRTLGRVQEVFELGVLEYGVPANPAMFKTTVAFGKVNRTTRHFGSLPYERMPEFWAWLTRAGGDEATRQLVMLIALTAKRTGEVRQARLSFLNERDRIWTTPAALMKRSRPHRVQLSSQALTVWRNASLLSTVPVLVFGKRDNKGQVISENAALQMVKRFDRSLTGHGFRASFKGWARAQRRYEPDAIELALAHRLPPLEEAYLREDMLEERAVMLQDWADFVCDGSPPVDLAEVVRGRGGAE